MEQGYIKPLGGYGRGLRAGYTEQNLLDIALIESLERVEGRSLLLEILANIDWTSGEHRQTLSSSSEILVDVEAIRDSVNFIG